MIKFRAPELEDERHDTCGNTVVAVLVVHSIKIPLCEECCEDLFDGIKEYQNTVFCKDCKHFGTNKWGYDYAGTCYFPGHNERDIDFMETCKHAEKKHD